MQQHANTLFVMSQGAYLGRDHGTLRVDLEGKTRLAVPMHHIEGIVCFGRIGVSPAVVAACGEHRFAVTFLTEQGKYLARIEPPDTGHVALRRQQYRLADEPAACLAVARPIIAAKVQNMRNLLLRSAREHADPEAAALLRRRADHMAAVLLELPKAQTLDAARGIEGETVRSYFSVFSRMVRQQAEFFQLDGRTRRPPLDAVNALLSFIYALVRHDCTAALTAVGLDPGVGYLHADRPGRLSLALDLMEEFRASVADRLVLTLINRRQVAPDGFSKDPGGAVSMDEKTRRAVLAGFQERKKEQIHHPLFQEETTVGLLPHLQARLLARTLRGDLSDYPALVLR